VVRPSPKIIVFLGLILGITGVCAWAGQDEQASEISAQTLFARLGRVDAPVVIDVRSVLEYRAGHVPGAINVPHTEMKERLGELQGFRDRDIVLYCKSGRRAAIAEGILRDAGYHRLLHLRGDMDGWNGSGLPVE